MSRNQFSLIDSSSGNAVEQFYDFHYNETEGDSLPYGKFEMLATGTKIAASTAGIYYWPSAAAYGADKPAWLRMSLILGNTVVGTLFLMHATGNLLDFIQLEASAPESLRHLVKLPPKKALLKKYIKMAVGSAICSIPFGVATYLFPLPGCESTSCLALIVGHSFLTNIILHLVSWQVILDPNYSIYYRLPLVPFEKAYQYYQASRLTPDQKQLAKCRQDQEKIYQKYRMLLSQFFTTATQKIVNTHLKDPESKATAYLRSPKGGSLMSLAEAVKENKDSTPRQSSSRLWCLCSSVHRLMMNGGVKVAGAIFMFVGCIGWVADPIYLGLSEGLTLAESLAAGILPAYSTAVLVAFYGAEIFQQVYEYLTSWKSLDDKLPLEARLYPTTFTLFFFTNLYMSVFSYATAQILITTIFEDEMWDPYRSYLQSVAYAGVPVLSFVPFFELFITFVRTSVAKFGPEGDQKLATRLLLKSKLISQRLQQIKGEELMNGLQQYTPEQQKCLGIDPEELVEDLNRIGALEIEANSLLSNMEEDSTRLSKFSGPSCWEKYFSFWSKTPDDRTTSLLTEASQRLTIN